MSLSRIEHGRHGISLPTLQHVLKALDITFDELVAEESEESDERIIPTSRTVKLLHDPTSHDVQIDASTPLIVLRDSTGRIVALPETVLSWFELSPAEAEDLLITLMHHEIREPRMVEQRIEGQLRWVIPEIYDIQQSAESLEPGAAPSVQFFQFVGAFPKSAAS